MIVACLLVLLSVELQDKSRLEYRVDLIEVNHCRTEHCQLDQIVFWDWSDRYQRYHCQGWVLVDHCQIDRYANKTRVTFIRGSKTIQVTAPISRTSFTSYDVERQNHEVFDPRNRIKFGFAQ